MHVSLGSIGPRPSTEHKGALVTRRLLLLDEPSPSRLLVLAIPKQQSSAAGEIEWEKLQPVQARPDEKLNYCGAGPYSGSALGAPSPATTMVMCTLALIARGLWRAGLLHK